MVPTPIHSLTSTTSCVESTESGTPTNGTMFGWRRHVHTMTSLRYT
jgi:hypothetical protein